MCTAGDALELDVEEGEEKREMSDQAAAERSRGFFKITPGDPLNQENHKLRESCRTKRRRNPGKNKPEY